MSFELKDLITIVSGVFFGGVAIIGTWFKFQNKVENLEHEDQEQIRQITALWSWKDKHEDDHIKHREEVNREMFLLKGANISITEQLKQIILMLTEIKERLAYLEKNYNEK